MAREHHVIYVPGLGDSRTYGQDDAVKAWRKHGLHAHYLALGWADKEPFAPKLKCLLGKIDELAGAGHLVSLVGVSAGASAVLNAYAQRERVHAVILIGGKVNNPGKVNQLYFRINPAFGESLFAVPDSLKRLKPQQIARIMSIHPLADGTVPPSDTRIPGSVEKTVPVIGHRFGIFFTIVFRSRTIANFIKSLPVK